MAITAEDLLDDEAARIGRDALATKDDVSNLRADIQKDMGNLRADIQKDMGNLSWKVIATIGAGVAILGFLLKF